MTVHYISIILLYPLVYKFYNTLKRVKYLKHSYMFRHYNVIIREYVVALLKLLYKLKFVFCYHCVIVACSVVITTLHATGAILITLILPICYHATITQ